MLVEQSVMLPELLGNRMGQIAQERRRYLMVT
jgi:hypothetical protein